MPIVALTELSNEIRHQSCLEQISMHKTMSPRNKVTLSCFINDLFKDHYFADRLHTFVAFKHAAIGVCQFKLDDVLVMVQQGTDILLVSRTLLLDELYSALPYPLSYDFEIYNERIPGILIDLKSYMSRIQKP